jgi:Ca-activated chloride channel family protein
LQKISEISGGQTFHAGSLDQLNSVYATLQSIIGYQSVPGDASAGWIRLGAFALIAALLAAALLNRRLPD